MLFDLTHPFHSNIPVAPIVPKVRIERVMHVGQDMANVSLCTFPSHCGTHLDAPLHFIPGGRSIDQIPLEWLCGPAIHLRVEAGACQEISADMLAAAWIEMGQGARVFIDTGFSSHYLEKEYFDHPYLAMDAVEWLLDRGARLAGLDTLTPEVPHAQRGADFNFPVHRALLAEEVLIIENVNFPAGLPDRFEVMALPLPFLHGDGAPLGLAGRAG